MKRKTNDYIVDIKRGDGEYYGYSVRAKNKVEAKLKGKKMYLKDYKIVKVYVDEDKDI